jgi:hypothetical protein
MGIKIGIADHPGAVEEVLEFYIDTRVVGGVEWA